MARVPVVFAGVGTTGDDNTTDLQFFMQQEVTVRPESTRKLRGPIPLRLECNLDLDLHLTTVTICITSDPVAFIPHKIPANSVHSRKSGHHDDRSDPAKIEIDRWFDFSCVLSSCISMMFGGPGWMDIHHRVQSSKLKV